jgi:hypothetical protein
MSMDWCVYVLRTDCMYDRAELRPELSGWIVNAMVDTLALLKPFGIPAFS